MALDDGPVTVGRMGSGSSGGKHGRATQQRPRQREGEPGKPNLWLPAHWLEIGAQLKGLDGGQRRRTRD